MLLLAFFQTAVAVSPSGSAQTAITSFQSIVTIIAGLSVVGAAMVAAVRLGRVLGRQDRMEEASMEREKRQSELHADIVTQLTRIEARIEVREMTTAERVTIWSERGAGWDAAVVRAKEELESHDTIIDELRKRTHELSGMAQTSIGKHLMHERRLDTAEKRIDGWERRSGPSDRRIDPQTA